MADKIKYPVIRCTPKTGSEPILCDGRRVACVQDYWRWAHSELNSNAERGKFAEYLVSLALDCANSTSEEWGGLRHPVGGRAGQGGGQGLGVHPSVGAEGPFNSHVQHAPVPRVEPGGQHLRGGRAQAGRRVRVCP